MGDSGSLKSCQGQTTFLGLGAVFCSVCLDAVKDAGERSIAKLKCGHHFHLDCIGSAFNAKGSMQCPNCRSIEEGQWLYASGAHRLEDFSGDGAEYDAFELFAGIINVLRPNDDLHSRHLQSSLFLPSYRQVSLVLEGANPQPSAFADLLVHALQNRDDGPSNSVHGCPYLAAQRMAFDDHVGAPYGHSSSPSLQSRRHSGSSPRMQTISSPERGTWSPSTARNFGLRPAANADNATFTPYPYERHRWSRPASSNQTSPSYGGSSEQIGGTGASGRSYPHSSRGNSTPFRHNASNQGQRANSHGQAPNTHALHLGSLEHSRRPRQRVWPSGSFPERNRSINGPRRHAARENLPTMPGSSGEWQAITHGYQWSRDEHPLPRRRTHDSERYWNPNQHFSSQAAEPMASDSFVHWGVHGSDGSQQARVELQSTFEGYPHARVNTSTGFPSVFVRDSSVEPGSPCFHGSIGP